MSNLHISRKAAHDQLKYHGCRWGARGYFVAVRKEFPEFDGTGPAMLVEVRVQESVEGGQLNIRHVGYIVERRNMYEVWLKKPDFEKGIPCNTFDSAMACLIMMDEGSHG